MRMSTPFARTAAGCIRAAVELEERSAGLYRSMAARFPDPPWFRELLQGLAVEEDQHALRIRMLERLHSQALGGPEDLDRIGRFLREALARTLEVEEVVARSRAPSPRALLDAITRLEETTGGAHAEVLAGTAGPEVRGLFGALATQDRNHATVLARARERLAPDDAEPGPERPGPTTRPRDGYRFPIGQAATADDGSMASPPVTISFTIPSWPTT